MGLIKIPIHLIFHWLKKYTRYSRRERRYYSKEEAGMLLFFTKTIDDDLYKIFTAKRQNFLRKFQKVIWRNMINNSN